MISQPQGESFRHTGHISLDGSHFGNTLGYKVPPLKSSSGSPKLSRLSRTNSDTSELAPLITTSGNSSKSFASTSTKPSRMGHTIGYIRDRTSNSSSNAVFGNSSQTAAAIRSDSTDLAKRNEKHEYHFISDNDVEEDDEDELFKKPLAGLGSSSLLDEVLDELDSSEKLKVPGDAELDADNEGRSKGNHLAGGLSKSRKDLRELVSSTLNLKKNKKKQLATVKPIKASDEKALDNAINLAHALASKSMHDLDKRTTDSFYDQSPGRSPLTPNSPSKKFTFFFPSSGGNKSPKAERKPFSEEARSHSDIQSNLSSQEKEAYKALVGADSMPPLSKLSPPESPPVQMPMAMPISDGAMGGLPPPPDPPTARVVHVANVQNPLPLPPKSTNHQLYKMQSQKRHVRKNPLIVPTGMVSNLIRNNNDGGLTYDIPQHPAVAAAVPFSVPVPFSGGDYHQQPLQQEASSLLQRRRASASLQQQHHPEAAAVAAMPMPSDHDEFEVSLEQNIDALDSIGLDCDDNFGKFEELKSGIYL